MDILKFNEIIDFINGFNSVNCVLVLEFLLKTEDSNRLKENLIDENDILRLDFKKFNFIDVSEIKKEKTIVYIGDWIDLEDVENCISVMKSMNALIGSLEKK